MSRLWWGDEAYVKAWVADQFPHLTGFGRSAKAVGWIRPATQPGHEAGWELCGGLVLAPRGGGWDGEITLYFVDGFKGTARQLAELYGLVFREWGFRRLTCHVAKDDRRARRLALAMGFRLEGVARLGYDGQRDACIYGMTHDKCRWLDYGRKPS